MMKSLAVFLGRWASDHQCCTSWCCL